MRGEIMSFTDTFVVLVYTATLYSQSILIDVHAYNHNF